MRTSFKFLASAAVAAVALTACNDNGSDDKLSNYETAIKAAAAKYTSAVVYATYGKLAEAGESLYNDLVALRDGTLTQSAIDKACTDFLEARKYWEQSEAFLFGAATDFSIDPHIDSWPLDRQKLAKNLSKADVIADLLEQGADAIDEVGASALGFHGIEFILFRDGANRTVAALQGEETAVEFKGSGVTGAQELIFAAAVAEDLMLSLFQLNVSWNPSAPDNQKEAVEEADLKCTVGTTEKTYGENMLGAAAKGSLYSSWQEVAQTILVAGCANIANEVYSSKMGQAASGDDESYIESPYSKKSFVDFKDNMLSIQYSLYGSLGATSAASDSILGFLKKNHAEEAAAVETTLAGAIAALDTCISSGVAFVDNCTKGNSKYHSIQTQIENAINAISDLDAALKKASSVIKD